ncbi:hypothetical protein MMC12_006262 [Toensbergia leucococca]|nr:hypothetical protein [Toensbergia leucococca]
MLTVLVNSRLVGGKFGERLEDAQETSGLKNRGISFLRTILEYSRESHNFLSHGKFRPGHFTPNSRIRGLHIAQSKTDFMTPSNQEILHSYRNLLRTGLHAVQYAKPARYTVQSRLRNAYRTNGSADFNAEKIQNTLLFLKNAAKETGLEHRILKNLLHVWWYQTKGFRKEYGSMAFVGFVLVLAN